MFPKAGLLNFGPPILLASSFSFVQIERTLFSLRVTWGDPSVPLSFPTQVPPSGHKGRIGSQMRFFSICTLYVSNSFPPSRVLFKPDPPFVVVELYPSSPRLQGTAAAGFF